MILIYCVCKDKDEAEDISESLLKKRLAACTNFFPMQSMYWWKHKLVYDNETVLIIKTVQKNYTKIEQEIKRMHSYTTPAIFSWKILHVEKKYENWLSAEIAKKQKNDLGTRKKGRTRYGKKRP
ncbi:MAG: divalent-cation tolerance protein CutA [Nanoarchaeota archaeon]